MLAVPGNVLSGRNRGAHALLKDGAKIVESADDILEELGMLVRVRSGPAGDGLPFSAAPPDPAALRAAMERHFQLGPMAEAYYRAFAGANG